MKESKKGFTLIELMIVVAIIGILAAIAIPKFAELIRKSSEGASKGNVGAVRSALSIYYGDMEGQYPDNVTALTLGGKYLQTIPMSKAPNYHADTSTVVLADATADTGGWSYNNIIGNPNIGNVVVGCTHTDSKGSTWTLY